jgi:signal transduction histidine kinase
LPSAEGAGGRGVSGLRTPRLLRLPRRIRRLLPRTFQGRLTIAFIGVIALILILVTVLVLNRLDDYFSRQQTTDLEQRAQTVSDYVQSLARGAAQGRPVVGVDKVVDPAVIAVLSDRDQQRVIADRLGQADVTIRFGLLESSGEQLQPIEADDHAIQIALEAPVAAGQTQERSAVVSHWYPAGSLFQPYAIQITLANPYTFRATALANVTGLLAAIALFALALSVVVSTAMARRFTTPLRRLTEASRGLAEGDLSRRVPPSHVRAGSSELAELALQFNAMADRLEESVEIIRRDRDRSRDFLADVSHELRTPLAALRTFNELLREGVADPVARAEFLESSRQQIERLDWLAQNLLELSKLDSGLVLLDLRPDDLRAAVESAVEQNGAAAERRGVRLTLNLPPAPIRIRHDPQRIGQVVANLVANAVKFTGRDGSVRVDVAATADGARIDVTDTGVGIDASELPHIFERFYRGSRANEARGSGSGLGLAIVRSIVDMHGGRVVVESRVGSGSRFTVTLPRDPRLVAGTPAAERADVASAAEAEARATTIGNMQETSPSERSQVNPNPAP